MKKNVVIFFTDQQRFDSLGCNGNVNVITPNIDALAADGCNFTRHLAANSVCMPSRASFMTGMYVPGHGVSSNGIPLWRRDNGCPDPNDFICKNIFGTGVPDKVPTMADYLVEDGYQTVLLGKLHAEPSLADKSYGFRSCYDKWKEPETECIDKPYYGFQYVKNVLGHGEAPCEYDHGHYGRWLHKNHPEIIEQLKKQREGAFKGENQNSEIHMSCVPSKYHNTTWLANEACEYLDHHMKEDQPLFMFVGFPDPHHDFTPPEDIAKDFLDIEVPKQAQLSEIKGEKSRGANEFIKNAHASRKDIELAYKYTQASVSLIDRAVGQVVAKLKEKGMYDDTVIIFTSDHGEMLGDYETLHKCDQPFYSLIHIPFVLKPIKGIHVPKVMNCPMSNVDVLPTVFSMIGVTCPENAQGVNILTDSDGNMPMSTCYNISGRNRNISIYNETYRYTYVTDTKEEELYNQIKDPHEYNNLAHQQEYRELCDEMKKKVLEKHLACETQIYGHYGVW